MRLGRGSATGIRRRSWSLAAVAGTVALTLGVGGAQAGAGALDATFGSGGKVLTRFGGGDSGANSVAIQPDGKIVAAGGYINGSAWALARYTKRGRLDRSFGSGGKVLTAFGEAHAVAIQPDGKIVAAGGYSDANGSGWALARYTRSGMLDSSFGSGGKVFTGFDDQANAVAIQPDGKIVAAGATGRGDFALARYTTSGSLDTTFGSGGKVLTGFGDDDDTATAVAIQPDGKIVASGYDAFYTEHEHDRFALARYTTSGSLDTTFGSGGKVLTRFGFSLHNLAYSVAIQPDGKIVAAGLYDSPGYGGAFVRYTKRGRLDRSFGSGGKVMSGFEVVDAVAIQADGKIVAAGSRLDLGYNDFALVRLTKRGRLDRSFGSGGKVVTRLSSQHDEAKAVAIQPDGKIVAAGYSQAHGRAEFALVRYMGR